MHSISPPAVYGKQSESSILSPHLPYEAPRCLLSTRVGRTETTGSGLVPTTSLISPLLEKKKSPPHVQTRRASRRVRKKGGVTLSWYIRFCPCRVYTVVDHVGAQREPSFVDRTLSIRVSVRCTAWFFLSMWIGCVGVQRSSVFHVYIRLEFSVHHTEIHDKIQRNQFQSLKRHRHRLWIPFAILNSRDICECAQQKKC